MTPQRALIEAAEEALATMSTKCTMEGCTCGDGWDHDDPAMVERLRAAISSTKAAEGVETKVEIRYRVDTVLFGKATPCSAAVKTREEAESYRLPIDRMTRIETREFIEVREKEGL